MVELVQHTLCKKTGLRKPNMAEVERSLSAMWNIRVNTMVKKVERQTHGVAVPISDRASNIEKKGHSDQVILAIKPKAIRQFSSRGVGLFPSSSPPMSVSAVIPTSAPSNISNSQLHRLPKLRNRNGY